MPSTAQYKAALPGASAEFILACIEAALPLAEAKDRFIEFQQRENERLAAELLASETVAVGKIQTRPRDPVREIFSKNRRRLYT